MAVFHAVRVNPGSLARSMRLRFHKPATTTVHRFLSEEAATSKRRIDLRGIFPPIVTTFGPQGELAEREVPGNVARWLREPLRGLVVQGSNGESVLLTEEERVAIVHTVRACLPLDRLLIAGSGCEGTLQTLEMTKKMADAGADAVLVVTPAYYRGRMTIGAFVNHYTQVANDSPVPVILYSVPGNTALELPIEAVVTLAQHPNIIGMKDSGGDISRIATIIHATQKEDFQMLAGSASFLFAAYAVGKSRRKGRLDLTEVEGWKLFGKVQLVEYVASPMYCLGRCANWMMLGGTAIQLKLVSSSYVCYDQTLPSRGGSAYPVSSKRWSGSAFTEGHAVRPSRH